MPAFMEHCKKKFAKVARGNHDADRVVRDDENMDLIFAWRELRKVTQNLTLHYDCKLYLLSDTAENRRLIGKYIDIFQYPDGRIEIRSGRISIPYSTYDKFSVINQGAIVENKRLGHALHVAQLTPKPTATGAACPDRPLPIVPLASMFPGCPCGAPKPSASCRWLISTQRFNLTDL
jgi:hypothetical protein